MEARNRVTRSRSRKIRKVKTPHPSQAYSPKELYKVERRGRKRMYGDLEEILVEELKVNMMSRLEIQEFAKKWARENSKGFTASNGWY